MSYKCPECGASLTDDSRFCKYCGAKIDDGVKRMEIKIDQRIEDVADIKRVSYEEQESKLRQKKLAQEIRAERGKVIKSRIFWTFIAILTIFSICCFAFMGQEFLGVMVLVLAGMLIFARFVL